MLDTGAKGLSFAYAKSLAAEAKKQLAMDQPHLSVRAKWKDHKPIGIKKRTILMAPSDNTGALSASITAVQGTDDASITMLGYGEVVDLGRSPGKGVPISMLEEWVDSKLPVHGDIDSKSLTYLVNRKIKFFGIEPTHFMDKAADEVDKSGDVDYGDDIFNDLVGDLKK